MSEGVDIRGALGMAVQFRCLTCGAVSDRPTGHLVRTFGVSTLAEIEARARCLRYIGGEKCGGRAAVTMIPRLAPPEKGFAHSRPAGDLDDTLPPELQGG